MVAAHQIGWLPSHCYFYILYFVFMYFVFLYFVFLYFVFLYFVFLYFVFLYFVFFFFLCIMVFWISVVCILVIVDSISYTLRWSIPLSSFSFQVIHQWWMIFLQYISNSSFSRFKLHFWHMNYSCHPRKKISENWYIVRGTFGENSTTQHDRSKNQRLCIV